VDENGTTSVGTGPAADHTTGSTTGNYLYTEASGSCNQQTAILVSPCIDLTFAPQAYLQFWFHMLGTNMGSLHVDAYTSSGWVNDIVTPISGNQGNQWGLATVSLQNFIGESVKLRIRGITGTSYTSDIAIDDISIDTSVIPDPPTVPVANFVVVPAMGCGATTVQFIDSSTGPPSSWFWQFPGGNPTSSTLQNPMVTYTTVGAYNVVLIVLNTLGSDNVSLNGVVVIHPDLNLTLIANDATCAGCNDGTIFAQVSGGSPGFSFQWNTGFIGNLLSNLGPGTYSVSVTDAVGCTATGSATVTEPGCPVVPSHWVVNVSPTSVQLRWDTISGVLAYQVKGRKIGVTPWTKDLVMASSPPVLFVSSLESNAAFEWQIRIICSIGNVSAWSALDTFYTECVEPIPTQTTNVTTNSATFNWSNVAQAVAYEIRGHIAGTTDWVNLLMGGNPNNNHTVFGLTPATQYEWQVRAWCDSSGPAKSNYTPIETFATLAFSNKLGSQDESSPTVTVYPNPFDKEAILRFFNPRGVAHTLYVTDISGRIIRTEKGIKGNSMVLKKAGLVSGIYLFELKGEKTLCGKFVVQ